MRVWAVDLADEADHAERREIEEERLTKKVEDLARFSQTDWVFEEENRRLHAEVVAMADCNRGESWRTQ